MNNLNVKFHLRQIFIVLINVVVMSSLSSFTWSPWPQISNPNIYSHDVAQFKTCFTLVKYWVIGWGAETGVVGMLYGALNDVERVCRGVELIQFVSYASAALVCWINFFCFHWAPSIHLKRGKPPTTNRDADQCRARLSTVSSYTVHAHAGARTHSHIHTSLLCMVTDLPNAPMLKHRKGLMCWQLAL